MPLYLTPGQIDTFNQNGYLVIPGFLDQQQTSSLLSRSKQLLHEFSVDDHPMTKFTTGDADHVGDDYFLSSGDRIRYFLEPDAVDKQGKLTRDKDKAVNKIGHALHELDPAFKAITLENEAVKSVVRDLDLHRDPVALQSMVICKQPEIGGEVGPHNDSTFLYTDPPTAVGFWFALEECREDNGALSFIPGSHLTAPITKRFVRLPQGGTGFETLLEEAPTQPSKDEYVLETCKPGDLVLIHGAVLHKSEKNLSQRTRFAYTFHVIDTAPHADYDKKNWLQPTENMPFSKLFSVTA